MSRFCFILVLFFGLSLFMHETSRYFYPYLETSSAYWSVFQDHKGRPNQSKKIDGSILVLGDSQIISGITPTLISKWEKSKFNQIIYLPRPSEQPEGMLSLYLTSLKSDSNLKKIYLNLSPISISKNSVVDSHKQLYTSFGSMGMDQLLNRNLRNFYFPNLSDMCWKVVITIFPYFSLNPNTSSLLNKLILGEHIDPILKERKKEYKSILDAFLSASQGSWVWKETDYKKEISEVDVFPAGSTEVFLNKRDGAIESLRHMFQSWRDSGIEVVILRIPFSPDMEGDLQKTNANFHLDQFIEEQQRIYKTVPGKSNLLKVYDIRKLGLNRKSFFADITHLNQKGRDVVESYDGKSLFDKASPSP